MKSRDGVGVISGREYALCRLKIRREFPFKSSARRNARKLTYTAGVEKLFEGEEFEGRREIYPRNFQ